MAIKCPICDKILKDRGLIMHLRNNHTKELKDVGYAKLKEQAERVPNPPKENILNHSEMDVVKLIDIKIGLIRLDAQLKIKELQRVKREISEHEQWKNDGEFKGV